MKKSYNKAFTLVELLAVIVILAIILVIAVPKIMDVINSSKKSTLETSVKMIASSAEKTKMQNTVLGKENEEITCSSVAKLSSNDYEECNISFDGNTAKVTVKGKGKFEGLSVCGGTKTQATAQEEMCTTDGKYFIYIHDIDNIPLVEVKDASKCTAYLKGKYCASVNDENRALCEEENAQICNGTYDGLPTIESLIKDGVYLSSDFEEVGLDVKWSKLISVTVENLSRCTAYLTNIFGDDYASYSELLCNGYEGSYGDTIKDYILNGTIAAENFETAGLNVLMEDYTPTATIVSYDNRGGKNVVIPSTINGYKVTEIVESAFYSRELTSVVIPNTVTRIGEFAFVGNELTMITIPNSVTTIGDYAFNGNPLSKVELSNPNIELGNCAFGFKDAIEMHNLPDSYVCFPPEA